MGRQRSRVAVPVPGRRPGGRWSLPFRARPAHPPPRAARLLGLVCALVLWLLAPPAAWAASLSVSDVHLEPCPSGDVGSQSGRRGPGGASCFALRGVVENPGRRPVVDTDVFALILDASGEPVLPNRSRVGSIGDIPPGRSSFALRLAVPAGTPGPFQVSNVRARGFNAPVRSRARDGDELLPLEQVLIPGDDLSP